MEKITSRDNPLIKQFVKLKTSASARREQGLFCIEGVKICLEAFSQKISAEQVFVTEQTLDKNENVREALSDRDDVFLISDSVAAKLSDTKTPQGIFCICRRLDKQLTAAKIESGGVYVMLCGIQDPGNLGTIIRTADGLGADGLILTPDCCDIYNPKVVRSTMGSLVRTDILLISDEREFLNGLSSDVQTVASVVDASAVSPQALNLSGAPCVLLIGNEGNGLSDETVTLCKHKTMIPIKGGAESFNAAVAAGILMWELLK